MRWSARTSSPAGLDRNGTRWMARPPRKGRPSLFSAHDERVRRRALRGRDPDALGLQIFTDRVDAAFAPKARMLHAAERHHVADGPVGVYPHRSGAEQFRHAHGAREIAGPDAGRKA